MAGVGRRTQYRKHVTGSLLNEYPVPDFANGERIAKVCSCQGGNQFHVCVAKPSLSSVSDSSLDDENDNHGNEAILQLAILPNKFHKLVWIKRNDFVIVRGSQEQSSISPKFESSNGVRYMIMHILYKDQIKYLKDEGVWPSNDPLFTETSSEAMKVNNNNLQTNRKSHSTCDGSSTADGADDIPPDKYSSDKETLDDEYLINTNRLSRIQLEDSDDEDHSIDDSDKD